MSDILIVLYVVSATLLGIYTAMKSVLVLRRLPHLGDFSGDSPSPEPLPRLTVIIAACDEADTLEPALLSLLAQDYPDLELVAVNDRSKDATGSILDRLARRDSRLRVEHIGELPQGWLGKVHALHRGTLAASGSWLLYTDADVHFRAGTLRRAVAVAQARRLDHLTLLPRVLAPSLLLKGVTRAFGAILLLVTRAGESSGSDSGVSEGYAGIGAFNLVRKAALERTEGFPWLRMEIGDDMGLAMLLKRGGARTSLMLAEDFLEVLWYPSVPAMFRGLEKNGFPAAAGFRWSRVWLACAMIWGMVAAPLVAILYPMPYLAWAGYAALGGLAAGAWVSGGWYSEKRGVGFFANLLVPLGLVLISFMLLRSAIVVSLRGGVTWRGTFYPIADLKQGRRLDL